MQSCTRCGELHQEPRCPFCQAPGLPARAMGAVGGIVTTLVMTACYGQPATDFDPPLPTGDTAGQQHTGDTAGTGETGTTGDTASDTGL